MTDPFVKYGVLIIAGMLLGTVFFGGLWLTVQRMQHSRHPGLLFIGSVVLRTVVVLTGIWYCGGGDAAAMAACLLGFVVTRLLATHGAAAFGTAGSKKEAP